MEEATIKDETVQDQGMYRDGKYPSIIDTDDLVFKMGEQLVQSMNKEKLLDKLIKRITLLESSLAQIEPAKIDAENRANILTESNKLYVENNQELDVELVKIRKELKQAGQDCNISDEKVEWAERSHSEAVKEYEKKIAALVKDQKEEIARLVKAQKKGA